MGEAVNLDEWRKMNNMEEDYLKYLTHVNKFLHVPTDVPDLIRCFYFTLRYLDGTVNAFEILSLVKQLPEEETTKMKEMVVDYLDSIKNQLMQY